ncbi:MAG: TCP-1/cpn60 chaperonin family protein, partial [Desulfuromonadales bacterium]|nr:TCP-1/cpn60 chaperonin family protein [Desulfuromonadales bacterium]
VALIRAIEAVAKVDVKGEQVFGVNIVKRALEEPLRQIAANAGQEGSIVVNEVKSKKGAYGFNAATDEYTDLVKAGIIDPTKVVRSALQNAASIAGLMLTTEACMIEKSGDDLKTSPKI